jgi:hypothetical protein
MALRSLYFQHAPGSRYKCVASNAIEAARFLIVESFYVHAMCSTIHTGMNRWWALLPYPVCSQRQFTNHIFIQNEDIVQLSSLFGYPFTVYLY